MGVQRSEWTGVQGSRALDLVRQHTQLIWQVRCSLGQSSKGSSQSVADVGPGSRAVLQLRGGGAMSKCSWHVKGKTVACHLRPLPMAASAYDASSIWTCHCQLWNAFEAVALDLARPLAELSLDSPDSLWEGRQRSTDSSFVTP